MNIFQTFMVLLIPFSEKFDDDDDDDGDGDHW